MKKAARTLTHTTWVLTVCKRKREADEKCAHMMAGKTLTRSPHRDRRGGRTRGRDQGRSPKVQQNTPSQAPSLLLAH